MRVVLGVPLLSLAASHGCALVRTVQEEIVGTHRSNPARTRSVLSGLLLSLGVLSTSRAEGPTPAYSPELLKPHLVAVEGRRRLNIFCQGQGAPTVVFEQGAGRTLLDWTAVLPSVSKLTRACVYERAGYGFSDASGRPMDATNVTSDLHALLRAEHVSTPVVLVGHSVGGLYATLYADRFPDEVAGLVLVDPSFAGQVGLKPTPDEAAMLKAGEDEQNAENARCAALARQGALSDAETRGCMPPTRPGRTLEEIAYLRQPYLRAAFYEAARSEAESLGREGSGESPDFREEHAARRSFGSMPVVVLTRDPNGPHPPGVSEERVRAAETEWMAGHDALAARSSRGRNTVVPGVGHMIHVEKPEAVVSAVTEVVNAVRGR